MVAITCESTDLEASNPSIYCTIAVEVKTTGAIEGITQKRLGDISDMLKDTSMWAFNFGSTDGTNGYAYIKGNGGRDRGAAVAGAWQTTGTGARVNAYASGTDTWEINTAGSDTYYIYLKVTTGSSPAAVLEIRRIKARVDAERLPRGADPNTHTKLGRGGLADVEWTVQLLQLRHAHEVPGLRTTSTLDAFEAIGAAELMPESDVAQLRAAWLTATRARNALVLVRGKPTDQLPGPGRQLNAVAAAAGWPGGDGGEFLDNYLRVTRRAKAVVGKVFGS
jgi:hypothetical protein